MNHKLQLGILVVVWLAIVVTLYSCQQNTIEKKDKDVYEVVYKNLYIHKEQSLNSIVNYWRGVGFIDIKAYELDCPSFSKFSPNREIKVTVKIEAVDGK